MQSRLHVIKNIALDLLFPQKCIGCGKEGDLICPACYQSLPRIIPPVCPRCGKSQPNGVICSGCVSWQANIVGIRSPFRFDGVIRQAIHQFKYKNLRTLAVPLSRLLQEYLAANPIPSEVLVPVPLHPRRLRERGYNQSGMLAENLGKLTALPVVPDCLIRTRFSIPQARTENVDERKKNVAGVFTCRSGSLANKQVLLIDDVATSGTTLDACALALKAGGATSVWGLVLAREI
jgi:ComF family protein